MKRITLALLALGIATPALAQSAEEWTWKATGQAEVTDGDTIKLRGVRIGGNRIAGIR